MSAAAAVNLKELVTLWDKYYAWVPMNHYECEQYWTIISKLRRGNGEEEMAFTVTQQRDLTILVDEMFQTIWLSKGYEETYDYPDYGEVPDEELTSCSRMQDYLENEAFRATEDGYDAAVQTDMKERFGLE